MWVAEEGDDGSLARRSDLLRLISSLPLGSTVGSIVGSHSGNDLACDLCMELVSNVITQQTSSKTSWRVLTVSIPSSFLASLTLPMLPAPMVLPSIHFPDCVGIVVRDRPWGFAAPAADAAVLASGTPCGTGAGPALFATAVAISELPRELDER